jgi:predicted MFS family arabinose efflux permease
MAATVMAPTLAENDGWASINFVACLLAGVALIGMFVGYERQRSDPLVPLSIFRHRGLVAGDMIAGLGGAWLGAEVLVLSLYCQQVLGYSALLAGLVALPQGVGGIVRGLIGPRLLQRMGIKRFLFLASLTTATGLFLLFRFPATTHYPLLAIVLFVTGFGTTNLIFGATVVGSGGVPNDEQGLPGALIIATRQVGGAVGIAILLSVASTGTGATGSGLAGGYRTALGWAAGLAIVAALVSLTVSRGGPLPTVAAPVE